MDVEPAPGAEQAPKDFFVSYTAKDRQWAEWIAFTLEREGYTTVLQHWDFKPGSSFIDQMDRASIGTAYTIGVLSKRYLGKAFPRLEMGAALAGDTAGPKRFLPIRIEEVDLSGLLAPIIAIDLFDQDEPQALGALLAGIRHSVDGLRAKPATPPRFPGLAATRPFPGARTPAPDASAPDAPAHETLPPGKQRRFIHSRVATQDWLQVKRVGNPYVARVDPTDDPTAPSEVKLHTWVWMPSSSYFHARSPQTFTPVVVVCAAEPAALGERLAAHLPPQVLAEMRDAPGRQKSQDRKDILLACCKSLADCFVMAVALPPPLQLGASSHASIAYQTILDLILVPLLEMHRDLAVHAIHLAAVEVGKESPFLLAQCKKMAKTILGSAKIPYSVELMPCDHDAAHALRIGRQLAWVLNRHHQEGDREWIGMVERAFEDLDREPPVVDDSRPD